MTEILYPEITIRAAGLYRLVNHLKNATKSLGAMFLDDDILKCVKEDKDEPVQQILWEIILHMGPFGGGAMAIFPSQDAKIMGKSIFYLINCYKRFPELYEKVYIMCSSLVVDSIFSYTNKTTSNNTRIQEILDLNEQLYNLSQKIGDDDVEFYTQFVEVDGHGFHPESQFINIKVKAKTSK